MTTPDHQVLIVGGGFAGIGMAIRLERDGEHDFLLVEQEDSIGGTWRDNHYPGCACDVPAPLYSFSFAPNPDWSGMYAGYAEIRRYIEDCVDEYGVRDRIRTGAQLTKAAWDEDEQLWRCEVNGEEQLTARVVIGALGGLTKPSIPDLDGLNTFTGDLFHSARWDHDADLKGKRVAVVGTGASAIQIVPEIAREAAQVDVYQRTPPWVLPKIDFAFGRAAKQLFKTVPQTQKALRGLIYAIHESVAIGNTLEPRLHAPLEAWAKSQNIRRQIQDPELRRTVTPDYRIGCKRILISNDWYRTLDKDHVELIAHGVEAVTAHGVVADGTERPADAIVLATGFRPTDLLTPLELTGRGGADVNDTWRDSIHAHRGTTIAGFPNLFILTGPNSGTGHQSQLYMIECQHEYVLGAVRAMRDERLASVEVRAQAEARFNDRVQARMQRTVWLQGGCSSWYLDPNGRNVTLWPSFTFQYRAATAKFDRHNYDAVPAVEHAATPEEVAA